MSTTPESSETTSVELDDYVNLEELEEIVSNYEDQNTFWTEDSQNVSLELYTFNDEVGVVLDYNRDQRFLELGEENEDYMQIIGSLADYLKERGFEIEREDYTPVDTSF